MSVIIKDMGMPNACWFCKGHRNPWDFYYECSLTSREHNNLNGIDIYKSKPDWCPLIEVPTPHDRLIDADKIEYHFEVNENTAMEGCEFVTKSEINRMSTVIEREE